MGTKNGRDTVIALGVRKKDLLALYWIIGGHRGAVSVAILAGALCPAVTGYHCKSFASLWLRLYNVRLNTDLAPKSRSCEYPPRCLQTAVSLQQSAAHSEVHRNIY